MPGNRSACASEHFLAPRYTSLCHARHRRGHSTWCSFVTTCGLLEAKLWTTVQSRDTAGGHVTLERGCRSTLAGLTVTYEEPRLVCSIRGVNRQEPRQALSGAVVVHGSSTMNVATTATALRVGSTASGLSLNKSLDVSVVCDVESTRRRGWSLCWRSVCVCGM